MKTTKELEKSIKQKIYEKIPNIDLQSINFVDGSDNNREGIFVFYKNGKYIFMYTERGITTEKEELDDEGEVLWNILDTVLLTYASTYAALNTKEGENFRRTLFAKEIELFSLFGEDFKKRKTDEIEKILLRTPYKN